MLFDKPMCANGCGRLAVIDDHIVGLADGGDLLDPANRQGLCRPCSDAKTQGEAGRGARRHAG